MDNAVNEVAPQLDINIVAYVHGILTTDKI